jgi:hypothetical protein
VISILNTLTLSASRAGGGIPAVINWNTRYAIAQYNYTFSPQIDDTTYQNILGRVNKFYGEGGSVEIHSFDHSKGSFTSDKAKADELSQQASRIRRESAASEDLVKKTSGEYTAGMIDNLSRFYRKGRFSPGYTRDSRRSGRITSIALTRDKNNNITAAMAGLTYPETDDYPGVFTVNGTSSTVKGHASVLQHAMLHSIVGEHKAVNSEVFNPHNNYDDQGRLKPWTNKDQTVQNNAITYHKGLGRRIEQKPDKSIGSMWTQSDVTRLIRNTRTQTKIKCFYNG